MRNNRGIGLGIFLMTLGILWALWSMGIVSWSIVNSIAVLWPLLLVVAGVNIIFKRNAIVGALTWVVFLGVLVSYSYFVEDVKYKDSADNRKVVIDRRAETQKGNLKISVGGTKVTLDSDTDKMLEAEIGDRYITYNQRSDNESSDIIFEKRHFNIGSFNTGINRFNNVFHLNKEVKWNIELNTGALDGNFNMSQLAVEKLRINTGAADLKMTLGEKASNTQVKLDAGASKIDFYVPKNAGVKVKLDGGLNDTNFNGPEWEKRDGYFYAKNYEQATVKIDMDVDMGVGRLFVNFD